MSSWCHIRRRCRRSPDICPASSGGSRVNQISTYRPLAGSIQPQLHSAAHVGRAGRDGQLEPGATCSPPGPERPRRPGCREPAAPGSRFTVSPMSSSRPVPDLQLAEFGCRVPAGLPRLPVAAVDDPRREVRVVAVGRAVGAVGGGRRDRRARRTATAPEAGLAGWRTRLGPGSPPPPPPTGDGLDRRERRRVAADRLGHSEDQVANGQRHDERDPRPPGRPTTVSGLAPAGSAGFPSEPVVRVAAHRAPPAFGTPVPRPAWPTACGRVRQGCLLREKPRSGRTSSTVPPPA